MVRHGPRLVASRFARKCIHDVPLGRRCQKCVRAARPEEYYPRPRRRFRDDVETKA